VRKLSKRKALAGCCAVTATALAVAVPGASGTTDNVQSKTPKITVADDYYAPATATVKAGGKVQFIWSDANTDTHNVVLTKDHPKGVKASDYRSGDAAVQYKFTPKFEVPGKYAFICTYHKTVMKTTVTVKK
jgi:plastocyanin